MKTIWGYSESDSNSTKLIGSENDVNASLSTIYPKAKQVFSALVAKEEIKGISIHIENIICKALVTVCLIIDDEKVYEQTLTVTENGIKEFLIKKILTAKTKIEIEISVKEGVISVPTSSIGIGMGYIFTNETYLPSQHLAFGVMV